MCVFIPICVLSTACLHLYIESVHIYQYPTNIDSALSIESSMFACIQHV